jgi:hypothetical protein
VLVEAHAALRPRGDADPFVVQTAESLRALYEAWGMPEKASGLVEDTGPAS